MLITMEDGGTFDYPFKQGVTTKDELYKAYGQYKTDLYERKLRAQQETQAKENESNLSRLGNDLTDRARGIGRSIIDGALFNYGNEAEAAIRSLAEGRDYDQVYKEVSSDQKKFEDENPLTTTATGLLGSLATGVPGAKAIMGTAKGMTNMAKGAARVGAVGGGIAGTGAGEGLVDRGVQGVIGAGGGALVGSATPYIGGAISKGYQRYGQRINPFNYPHPKDKGIDILSNDYLSKDDTTWKTLIDRAESRDKNLTTLTDVADDNTKDFIMSLANMPGKQKTKVKQFYTDRQAGSTDRLVDASDVFSKRSQNLDGFAKQIDEESAEIAKTYKRITGEDGSPGEYLSQDAVEEIYKDAVNIIGQNGALKKKILPMLKGKTEKTIQNGRYVEPAAPEKRIPILTKKGNDSGEYLLSSYKDLHHLQQDLRDMANKAFKNKQGRKGAAVLDIQKKVIDTLSKHNDEYSEARKLWRDEKSIQSALEDGYNALKGGLDPFKKIELKKKLNNYSKTEQQAFIAGYVENLQERLGKTNIGANAAGKLRNTELRQRLRHAFPDEEAYNKFIQAVDNEVEYGLTKNRLYGGSQTQPRGEANKAAKDSLGMDDKSTSTVWGDAKETVWHLLNLNRPPQLVIDEIMNLMNKPISEIPQKTLNRLRKHKIGKNDLYAIQGYLSAATGNAITTKAIGEIE